MWGPNQDTAFQRLKEILFSPPILAYPDYGKPFELHVDASSHGLGAVLYQEQDGKKRVISYASRSLSRPEANYSVHRLEFLSLKWAISKKYHEYLYGNTFTVLTDNNPLTYVLTTAKLDATGHRWLATLAAYDFNIIYRPGSRNTDADALSRLPALAGHPDNQEITADSVRAVCGVLYAQPFVEALCTSADVVDTVRDDDGQDISRMCNADWRKAQASDNVLKHWMDLVRIKKKPRRQDFHSTPVSNAFYRAFDSLVFLIGILHRQIKLDGQVRHQMVLPSTYVQDVLYGLHTEVGHPGRDRTLSLIRDRFFWPGMSADVEEWIKNCNRCVRRKSPTNVRAPLVNITTTQPLELVCMDFLTLETSKGGFQHQLIITDHFTRYAQAIPCKNTTAKTTAEAFYNGFIVHYGIPRRIHSDQGANFESRLLKELCLIWGMQKSRTTSYHPMGNGMCERFNRTLLDMLGTLSTDQKKDWKKFVGPLVHAYNCTRHDSTGYSPFFLMFGREPRLPIDLAFGIELNKGNDSLLHYTHSLREKIKHSCEMAAKASEIAQQRQKAGYDLKVRGATLEVGDRVLVKTLAFDGKHKLADRWDEFAYIVISQPNKDIPVFVVEREDGEGRRRSLHRNHLLPIGYLLPDEQPKPKPRNKPPLPKYRPDSHDMEETQSEIDDFDMFSTADDGFISIPGVIVEENASVSQGAGDDQPLDESEGDASSVDEHMLNSEEAESIEADPVENQNWLSSDERDSASSSPLPPPPSCVSRSPQSSRPPEKPPPQPAPRRSTRQVKKPAWMDSGNYVMVQNVPSNSNHKSRIIEQLANSGVFHHISDSVANAIISVIHETAE